MAQYGVLTTTIVLFKKSQYLETQLVCPAMYWL